MPQLVFVCFCIFLYLVFVDRFRFCFHVFFGAFEGLGVVSMFLPFAGWCKFIFCGWFIIAMFPHMKLSSKCCFCLNT